eukprot:gb/GFBE01014056.1/.p1 GENE.gb/GFBE01014056.1/~~gb/GFBE01014056.1/.p1  ORF type:complete len:263 (+),score=94.03 gb/GFBE01014056.1/:1-789(+)
MAILRCLCLALALAQVEGLTAEFAGHIALRHKHRAKGPQRLDEQKRNALYSYHSTTASPDLVVKGNMDKLQNIETKYHAEMKQRREYKAHMFAQIAKKKQTQDSEKGQAQSVFKNMQNLTQEDETALLRKTQEKLHELGFEKKKAKNSTSGFKPGKAFSPKAAKAEQALKKASLVQAKAKASREQHHGSLIQQTHQRLGQRQGHQHKVGTVQQVQHQAQQREKVMRMQENKQKQLRTKQLQAQNDLKEKLMQMATKAALTFG